jgi:hypothetical protein
MTNYHYWQYFLSLETDLITTSRYIEFSGVNNSTVHNNDKTFSTELLRIFLTACAECENILKIILAKHDITNLKDISQIKTSIRGIPLYRELPNQIITCEAYNLKFTPWEAWNTSNKNSPQWWQDHNAVKHGRANDTNSNYHLANVFNTLSSVAALMCLLFEYYKKRQDGDEGENVIKYRVELPPTLAPKLFIPKESGLGYADLGYGENWTWVWAPGAFGNT